MTFLGVQIDLDRCQLSLDPVKAADLRDLLLTASCKTRLSKSLLQTVAGRLVWAARVHCWGRWHIAPFFHAISSLKGQRHKTRISADLLCDLQYHIT